MFPTVGDIDRMVVRERIDANNVRFISSGTMDEAGLIMKAMDITAAELEEMLISLEIKRANRIKNI